MDQKSALTRILSETDKEVAVCEALRIMYADCRSEAHRLGFTGNFTAFCREVMGALEEAPTSVMWVQVAQSVVDCLGIPPRGSRSLQDRVVAFIRDRDIFSQEMMDDDILMALEG